MRLLNTTTITLHTFFDKALPDYVILSHRWDEEEVTIQDLQSGRGPGMPGFAKIQGCCAQAKSEGWDYAWIDSCCIDKRSSAELSEAINSMFKWYEGAQVCYAYLSDVDGQHNIPDQLKQSAWFKRGWTLQELLAPAIVVFFDKIWTDIGTKRYLEDNLSSITGIRDLWRYKSCCVAEKLSWASGRTTTRVEDEAYCLMGLFDINMPLLYGEGPKAFQRLQEAILKSSDDESLFAWTSRQGMGTFLAPSSKCFAHASRMRHAARDEYRFEIDSRSYFRSSSHPVTVSSKGVHVSLFLIPIAILGRETVLPRRVPVAFSDDLEEIYIALLQDLAVDDIHDLCPAILIRKMATISHEAYQERDWTCVRVYHDLALTMDLNSVKSKCQTWLATVSSVDEKESVALRRGYYPRSRQVFIQADENWELWSSYSNNRTKFTAKADILVKLDTLRSFDFRISQPIPIIHDDVSYDLNMSGWYLIDDTFRLRLTQTSHDAYDSRPIYFLNRKTREMILLLVSIQLISVSKTPLLVLLAFKDSENLKRLSQIIPGLLKDWRSKMGELALGSDRVSCTLKDGTSLSSAVRVVNKQRYNFIIDFAIEVTGVSKWPASAKLQAFTDYLTKEIQPRDTDWMDYSRA